MSELGIWVRSIWLTTLWWYYAFCIRLFGFVPEVLYAVFSLSLHFPCPSDEPSLAMSAVFVVATFLDLFLGSTSDLIQYKCIFNFSNKIKICQKTKIPIMVWLLSAKPNLQSRTIRWIVEFITKEKFFIVVKWYV